MNVKKTTIYSILIIFFINAFLVFAYYKFYLVKKINSNIVEISLKYENDINSFIKKIGNSNLDNIKIICEEITSKYNSILIVKNETGQIIYSNEKNNEKRPFYISTRVIEKEEGHYILNYYDNTDTSVSAYQIIQNFLIFQLILSIIVIIIAFILASFNIIKPVSEIFKDFKNYKIGIKPKKRKVKTQIDEIQNNLIELIEKIEEEKLKQNRIIASISHDIKTPLTSIMGYAGRLDTAILSEDTKKNYVKKIYNKSTQLKELLEEFDDYLSCNIELTLKKEIYDIKYILNTLEKDYKEELKEKNIDFKIISKVKNENILVDISKLKRVFSNIITNSVNHLNKKKGIIILECKSTKEYFEFVIKDNAGGVKEEELKKIFDPLFTTDPSRRIPGLGLSICKEIINTHNGNIYAKNNVIGGLSIYFNIKK